MPSPFSMLAWIGMAVLLGAYFRRETLPPMTYAALNLVAGLLIAPVCWEQRAWPPFALQLAWAAIAVRDLVRAMRAPRPSTQADTD